MSTAPALQILELTKDFGGLRAVDQISFQVDEGEFVGLIGPNGCGKTTPFNCISGMSELKYLVKMLLVCGRIKYKAWA